MLSPLPKDVKRRIAILACLPRLLLSRKTCVVVLSSMRSGSTLLSALLAEAPDIGHLPEVLWSDYLDPARPWDVRYARLCPERIVVLKKPPWFHSTNSYYRIAGLAGRPAIKVILLVRHPYDVVRSLRHMPKGEALQDALSDGDYLRYWCETYEGACSATVFGESFTVVRYEDLVESPRQETERLFRFLGSARTEGTDTYSPPTSFSWKWGRSDNSNALKTMRVQPSRATYHESADAELAARIGRSARARVLLERFGYSGATAQDLLARGGLDRARSERDAEEGQQGILPARQAV